MISIALATATLSTPVGDDYATRAYQVTVELRSAVTGEVIATPSMTLEPGKVGRTTMQCPGGADNCRSYAVDTAVTTEGLLTTVALTYREWDGDSWVRHPTPPIVFLSDQSETRFEAARMTWDVKLKRVERIPPHTI